MVVSYDYLQINNDIDSESVVATNIGNIPIADYLEIMSIQYGFDSYDDLLCQGYSISNSTKFL